ncbi:DUF308 domain-containing protein [Nakamurella lactea]|uniref:DUF308 domain-containing protein n=1 Tax=Nakamurella lactea TaxID=459515 RepID=UPI0004191A50|nr:DUF308 domain-containing protein [Nakamurella lactea]
MTTATPGGNSADDDPGGRRMDEDEISRRFSEIVSPMSQQMHWDVGADALDAAAGTEPGGVRSSMDYFVEPPNRPPGPADPDAAQRDTAERRRLRREQRKANRSAEAAAFAAEQARREAEYAEDDQHYVPGEPPPLTMPKVRTLISVLLIACGIFLLVGPNLLTLSPDGVMIVSAILVLSGGSLLVAGLRRHRNNDPGEGWDDGSRV